MRKRNEQGQWIRQPVEVRFWEYVDKGAGPNRCWIWQGPVSNAGYGRFTDYWQKFSAHRLSYEFAFGPIPPGQNVCHTCDERLCVNPAHLWLGSHKDNNADMWAKDRANPVGHVPRRGTAVVTAKLTDSDVLAIRAAYQPAPPGWPAGARWRPHGRKSVRALAAEYGVAPSLIHRIVKRQVWTHL